MNAHLLAKKFEHVAHISVLICFLVVLGACTNTVELLTDVSEGEVNEVIAALAEAGIAATKRPGKEGLASITVNQNEIGRAVAILNGDGLPRERFAKMGEVFKKEGLISSPVEERARYLWALSQELAATISQIDGVLKARVHVVLPERSTGSDPAVPSSAAVFIKFQKQYNMDETSIQIKRLVANSISGLSTDKVAVVLLPSVAPRNKVEFASGSLENTVFGYPVPLESLSGLRIFFFGMLFFSLCTLGAVVFMAWQRWGKEWNQKLRVLKARKNHFSDNDVGA
jgi:type III secretion protein J